MKSNNVIELCDSDFLNLNETWYTSQPTFSGCFRDTVLSWIPACVFILVITNEFSNIKQSKLKPITWNIYNSIRLLLTISLFICKLTQAVIVINAVFGKGVDEPIIISRLSAPIVQTISYTILGIIYCYQRRAGLHTSCTIWFYIFISLICNLFDFYATLHQNSLVPDLEQLVNASIHIFFLVLLFLFECRGDSPIIERDDPSDLRPDSPEIQASYFSSITFWWFNKFLLFGYRSRLRLVDLWQTLPRDQARELVPLFRSCWLSTRTRKSSKKGHKRTYQLASGEIQPFNGMIRVLMRMLWARFLFAASLKFVQDSLQFTTPIILKKLLAFMSDQESPNWHGILWAIMLLVVSTVQSITLGNYFYRMQLIGQNVKSMIVGSVYRKALLLSGSSRLQSTTGQIVNLMSVDSQRFQDLVLYVNLFWSAPYQIILSIVLLYRELGWSIFAGVIGMALMLPCNAYIARQVKMTQIKLMKTKDERVKQINEVLSGIKVIKLYAWENSFISNLIGFRSNELRSLAHLNNLDALQVFLWNCSPFIVACVTFAVYVYSDSANILSAEKAFVSISLFNLLRFPLTMLPMLINSLVLTFVSSRRLSKFLNNDELVRYVTREDELEAVSIEGGTLAWSSGQDEASSGTGVSSGEDGADRKRANQAEQPSEQAASHKYQQQQQQQVAGKGVVLRDVNLHVRRNSFVAVVGQVASGKSSLLAAILGEMHRLAGRFNVGKGLRVAYVPQQAWIQNMSVRDNILFGRKFERERYERVLVACSLQADLDTLPGGDEAEIGEKGINLSGGQKQRVSLARACYSDSDLYLLDDPLSALDSHVAKHVFEQVLGSPNGLLRDKTRILATNSLFVVPHADQVVVLEAGRVLESGSYEELMSNEAGQLSEFMRQYSATQEERRDGGPQIAPSAGGSEQVHDEAAAAAPLNSAALKSLAPAKPSTLGETGKLVEAEHVELGSVNYAVYMAYFRAVSWSWLSLLALSLIGSTSFQVCTNLWLALWASDAEHEERAQDLRLRSMRMLVYATFGGLQCLLVLVGSLSLSRGAVRAAGQMHSSLLERIMHSPMVFFDTTPIGRIVNRFAKDIDVVDSTLPGAMRSWFTCLLSVISTIFVICYSFPTFLAIVLPLALVYYLIQKLFIVTTRQLKRLESTTRSPIYSNFNETLTGISSIRAYDCAQRFIAYSDSLIDRNLSCSYPNVIANRWLSVRLEFFGNLITCCAALFSVFYKSSIGAGVAGLCISYSLSITQTLSWLVRMTSDLETHIVSVERILEYVQNKQEDSWLKEHSRPSREWPHEGRIELSAYSTRYRQDTELVLRNISLSVRPREKIGIVGRTGSGKSSLSLALFRVLEPASGSIAIDGRALTDFGLHDIRSRLTIIPQDPVLFSGSLRFNLDPLAVYPDADIWRALEQAHLSAHLRALNASLEHQVSEYGENFSLGQRQLICLARAILRKSRILILDEATASVDLETDSIVQRTIRELFADCTIITIAHRLHTILDSDRILVLDSGRLLELDTPERLLDNPRSAFASLVRDANVDTSSILRQRGRHSRAQPSE